MLPSNLEVSSPVFRPAVFGLSPAQTADSDTQALLSRPRRTVRGLIVLGFAVCFLLALVVNLMWIYAAYRVEEKLHFLEIADTYLFEVQQARRFEKNFFLYGSNLSDAVEHMRVAHRLLKANAEQLRGVMAKSFYKTMVPRSEHYLELLEQLHAGRRKSEGNISSSGQTQENEIRLAGGLVIELATDLVVREREAVHQMIGWARTSPIYFLAVLLALIVIITHFLIRRMLRPLDRFIGYTRRIAQGDFTPIKPVRSYRDEFTELAISLNMMTRELERGQKILVESHKLRAVGTLTAGVAHELNNPINNILLTAQMLKEDYQTLPDEERLDMVDDLISQAERSQRIVRDLLDFARESETKIEPLDLSALVNEVVRLAQNQIRLARVKLETQATPNLPRIHGDSKQLVQVFLNLLLNALEATDKDGRIKISTESAGDSKYVYVRVSDNGRGIPSHLLSSIFDPFFTTKQPGDGKAGGTGLGLSVSQGIVARHGGNIMVSSQEGVGTSFTVYLPVTTIPAEI